VLVPPNLLVPLDVLVPLNLLVPLEMLVSQSDSEVEVVEIQEQHERASS